MFKNTRTMTEVAILIALAFILDLVSNMYSSFIWAYGGSFSLSLVPLAIIGYRHGWKAGFVGGFLMGLLQLLLGAFIVHPAQVLLDYPLPFAMLGLAGFWSRQVNSRKRWRIFIILSTFIASLLRLACHILAGYIFWSDGLSPRAAIWNSIIYNTPYVAGSWVISCIVLVVLYKGYERMLQPPKYMPRRY
ncbi:MAG: energy-coupled thiamine transporter ThiT [Turicibacter sp.]|nr:energy-coupled thiamine transporter ThiT [Turicibacter sp.]